MLRYILLLMLIPVISVRAELVSFWNFESIDSGTIVTDSINSFNGTVIGAATLDPDGIQGNAISFDGSSYTSIDSGITAEIQDYPFSVSCWVKVASQPVSTYAGVWLGNTDSDFQYFQVGPRHSLGVMVGRNDSACDFDAGLVESADSIDDDQWHHIAAVFSSANDRKLYIDGNIAGAGVYDCPFISQLNAVTLGCNNRESGPTDYLRGSLDEVRIFNHTLSPEEVKEYYLVDQTIAYWPFDTIEGTEYFNRYQSTISGTLALVEGVSGQGCYFNGTSYINVSGEILNEITDYPFSMSYWFKVPEQAGATYAACWLGNKNVNDRYFQTGIRQGKAMLTVRNPDFDLGLVESPTELDDDRWHHAVAVFNASDDRQLYVDGTLVNTDNDSVNFIDSMNRFAIGRNSRSSATDYIVGSLDELYVYNKALTAVQIKYFYDIVNAGDTLKDTLYLDSQTVSVSNLYIDGGTLHITGECVIAGRIEVLSDMQIDFADSQASLIILSDISGSGSVTVGKAGSVSLQGDNSSFSGNWLIDGSLKAQSQASLGSGNITVNNGANLAIEYDLITTGDLTLDYGATMDLYQDLIVGSLFISGQELTYGCYDSQYLYQVNDNMFAHSGSGSGSICVGPVLGLVQQTEGNTRIIEHLTSSDSFSISLLAQPEAPVSLTIDPQMTIFGNDIQLSGTASPGDALTIILDASNWNIPQAISVTAVVDGIVEPEEIATLAFTIRQNGVVIGIIKPLDVLVNDALPTGLLADLDNSGEVAVGDLAVMASDWLEASGFNLAGNAEIELDDLAVLGKQWGKVVRPDLLADYSSHLIDGNEILFNCGLSQVKVSMCNSRMARIQLSPDREYRNDNHPDYFMVQKYNWPPVAFTVSDEGSYIKIATADMVIRARKSPFGLQMYKADNETLLVKDDDAEGMYWRDNTVGVKRVEGPGSGGKFGFGGGDHGNTGLLNKNTGFSQFTVTHGRVPVPFYMSTCGYGIFLNTVSKNTAFDATGGFSTDDYLDYWFMAGPSFKSMLANYSELTGRMNLFPKWAYGFMLSKYGNDDATQNEFSDWINWLRYGGHPDDDGGDGWPTDCYVFDYGWRGGKWYPHRWDPDRYPDLPGMFQEADSLGFHVGLHNNYGTPEANNGNFTDPAKADIWWKAHLDPVIATGYGDWFWPDEFDVTGDNLMANRAAKVVHEKWLEYTTQQRPVFITRGGYAGQHYACGWSGDIANTIEVMNHQIVNQQAVGLSGYPWFSHDLGGFKAKPSDNLYIRWVAEFGSFCSIMRAHGHDGREPWLYSKNAQGILRKYLKLRYKLFPYIYTSAWQGTAEGIPMMRAMALEYQDDPAAWAAQNQYFWGDWFLIAPALSETATDVNVWIPPGQWYDYFNGTKYTGPQNITVRAELDEIPVFVKAGAIVPMGPEIRYADELPLNEITLDIYPVIGTTAYTLYEDDGITRDYLLNDAYSLTRYEYSNTGSQIMVTIDAAEVRNPAKYSPFLPRDYYCRFNDTVSVPVQVSKDNVLLLQYSDEPSFRNAAQGWYFDNTNNMLWTKVTDDGTGCVLEIQ